MSVKYVPVQWNPNKYWYDAVLITGVVAYIWLFLRLGSGWADTTRPVDGAILRIRAFGTCAFVMLTMILMIGPLARLDRRFLPVLYNRRHFGVVTAMVAGIHAVNVLGWYYAYSPIGRVEGVLGANTSYGQVLGFPFEALGIFALFVLLVLAATSHDFWLSFLTAPVWKGLHLLIYPAYVAVVGHIVLGYLQDARNPTFALIACGGALAVAGLHLATWRMPGPADADPRGSLDGWLEVGAFGDIADQRAVVVHISGDERAAVFRNGQSLSAVSNACAHQNGPLGEGRIIDGCITCPWHGFQYRAEDGCAPAPFTEKIPTYALRAAGGRVYLNPKANAPGTAQAPLTIPVGL